MMIHNNLGESETKRELFAEMVLPSNAEPAGVLHLSHLNQHKIHHHNRISINLLFLKL